MSVSALGLLSPITALILGWTFPGEALGSREISVVLLVLASLAALQMTLNPPKRNARQQEPVR